MRPTFPKTEHLKLEKDIAFLFSAGSRASTVQPVRAVYRLVPATDNVKVRVLVSVAKKRLHHAVDRNRTNRLLREAYRLNKHLVVDSVPEGKTLHLGFIWLSSSLADWKSVEKSIATLLRMVHDRNLYRQSKSSDNA